MLQQIFSNTFFQLVKKYFWDEIEGFDKTPANCCCSWKCYTTRFCRWSCGHILLFVWNMGCESTLNSTELNCAFWIHPWDNHANLALSVVVWFKWMKNVAHLSARISTQTTLSEIQNQKGGVIFCVFRERIRWLIVTHSEHGNLLKRWLRKPQCWWTSPHRQIIQHICIIHICKK